MRSTHNRSLRGLASVIALVMVALVLPLAGPAFANSSPPIDVEPEITTANQHDRVTLTASLVTGPAPHIVNIDWENEGGPNDTGDDPPATTRTEPDESCDILPGAISCSITYFVSDVGNDPWRAWVDQDHEPAPFGQDVGNATDDSDQDEARDESRDTTAHPDNPAGDACQSDFEPDCTDVVLVTTGALEVAPDVQTVDAGSTARLIARTFAPVQEPDGKNIDFENEGGRNDSDASDSPMSPDETCDIPQGARECFIEYQVRLGRKNSSGADVSADTWRVWIDRDKVQSTVEADETESRWSTSDSDCSQPEDPPDCRPSSAITRAASSPGNGCEFEEGDTPDRNEPDCTDVVDVTARAGFVTQIDCDDTSGAQNQNTERETNPTRPSDTRTGDPSTERYKCEAFDQFGNRKQDVVIKGENENGVNDPDPSDGASYTSPDYQCTTTFNEDDPPFLEDMGVCFIQVRQDELERGTAEICFWSGTAAEGQALCGDEPTGENQLADGTDAPNDLADQVEKTWEDPATFRLDCNPETDTNPAGTAHTVTCQVTSSSGSPVNGVQVDAEATGDNDPDSTNSAITPDFTCETEGDGACSFTHTGSSQGTTTYRAWIDADRNNSTTEADATEGRDETITAGTRGEPDNTDVVEKTWGPPPANLSMTPESDTAQVGECNPYTITVTDSSGNPVPGAIIDVEQRHERADNQAADDEPTVSFCEPPPSGGPNPSDVDESRGDLGSTDENPDNQGTAGGETTNATDQNGKVTIGIEVSPGNGSSGTGGVSLTAWFETDNDDDPESGEPQDSSTKSWTPAAGEPGVPAALSLTPTASTDSTGDEVTYTATVSDVNGDAVEGATVVWTEDGEGAFVSEENTTDANGQAQAVVTSTTEGSQTITATAEGCTEGATCSDSSTQTWEDRRCPGFENDDRNQIVGTSGDDRLEGTEGDDIICGLGGKDTILGHGGDDLLLGGGGKDIIKGHDGTDELRGGGGNDTMSGGADNDLLIGQGGFDTLKGNSGDDRMRGKNGQDILQGGTGHDDMFGNVGKDVLRGFNGRDKLNGGGGNDILKGQAGNDRLFGGGGDDTVDGGAGQDSCNGGSGNDTLRRCE